MFWRYPRLCPAVHKETGRTKGNSLRHKLQLRVTQKSLSSYFWSIIIYFVYARALLLHYCLHLARIQRRIFVDCSFSGISSITYWKCRIFKVKFLTHYPLSNIFSTSQTSKLPSSYSEQQSTRGSRLLLLLQVASQQQTRVVVAYDVLSPIEGYPYPGMGKNTIPGLFLEIAFVGLK